LKSPTTETSAAFGAKTAKAVPATPSRVSGCEPSFSQRRVWVPWWKRKRSSGVRREEGLASPTDSFFPRVASAREPPWMAGV